MHLLAEITNLLSVTVFLGMVSEITPPTSESIPIIGSPFERFVFRRRCIAALFSCVFLSVDAYTGLFDHSDVGDHQRALPLSKDTSDGEMGEPILYSRVCNNVIIGGISNH